ncbi:LysR family transcriptional regulator [Kaistia algarum]|uniref:LysR family transcriptional regulator n=1 Tax=Kaistia algarum TaxID=2083279 RepID=UPI000CE8D9D1|nr:LysR family transcriptional regulator [Kaistia algarum]MCX5516119.1 LysR family transcriptional regulator [Kaistia algarum]PPE78195.1 LysR family transcriptional regulator [Kaistia algarum]
MYDLDLLKSFVSVVDAGGFTRAGERVHRTQSTVSQQIRKLEDKVGAPLIRRDGRGVSTTEAGERLLPYARRILALSLEAASAVGNAMSGERVGLGLTEDFAIAELTGLVAAFSFERPDCRLDIRCDLSVALEAALLAGDLDIALLKRDAGGGPAYGSWPERLVWATAARSGALPDPLPLIAFPQGCRYRNRAVHALEAAGRRWRIAYESASLVGIDAAIAGGLGVALIEARALRPAYRVLGRADGFPDVPPTELALLVSAEAGGAARELATMLAGFCNRELQARAA